MEVIESAEATKTPKIFISYAWTNQEYKKRVELFCRRLYEGYGIDVLLDQWELIGGNDLYHYMEKCVADTTVTKVLILCNELYTQKANDREGGTGVEATIITPKIYLEGPNQSRFIPVLFDTSGQMPVFLKSRTYYDLSTDEALENNIVDLVKCIYDQPPAKPKNKGKIPAFILYNKDISMVEMRTCINLVKINGQCNRASIISIATRFADSLNTNLIEYFKDRPTTNITPEIIEEQITGLLPFRDYYLEALDTIASRSDHADVFVIKVIEGLQTGLFSTDLIRALESDCGDEAANYFIWELMITTTTLFMALEKYHELAVFLQHKYICGKFNYNHSGKEVEFSAFIMPFCKLRGKKSPQGGTYRNYAAEVLIHRELYPYINKESMIAADILMFQLSCMYYQFSNINLWNPHTTPYFSHDNSVLCAFWHKLLSRSECQKLLGLFQVENISRLRDKIKEFQRREEMKLSGASPYIVMQSPYIEYYIHYDEIATRA